MQPGIALVLTFSNEMLPATLDGAGSICDPRGASAENASVLLIVRKAPARITEEAKCLSL